MAWGNQWFRHHQDVMDKKALTMFKGNRYMYLSVKSFERSKHAVCCKRDNFTSIMEYGG